ncbi:MAG: winged helix-turn-helix domain-containing protein [Oscillospiraceae bacterium]|nr:winged helix-turn-helix domain-containing protein [Oscillospiraceae bacterium]
MHFLFYGIRRFYDTVSKTQIYYVLHRHGWRKVMPRSKHPQEASEAVMVLLGTNRVD